MKKIAIIGSGISGLSAAYALCTDNEVTLYESADRLGGHANTINIKEIGDVMVDTGFMVFNPKMYPNLVNFFEYLKIETKNTEMNLTININNNFLFKSDFPKGVFIDKKNIVSIKYIYFLFSIINFRRLAKKELLSSNKGETLSDFFNRKNINKNVASNFLYPMISAIWSSSNKKDVSSFPAYETFIFLNNHNLLDQMQPKWKTVVGGSIEYVKKVNDFLSQNSCKINLNSKILGVESVDDKVSVILEKESLIFDKVIFSTHADTALALIKKPSAELKNSLELFKYSKNTTIIHGDKNILPSNEKSWSAWNYVELGNNVSFTYNMNILQHIDKKNPVFVTLNPKKIPNADKIYKTIQYEHPIYSDQTLKGQLMMNGLQGQNNFYFAGAHLGYGFHEDGITSAMKIIDMLGSKIPWNQK